MPFPVLLAVGVVGILISVLAGWLLKPDKAKSSWRRKDLAQNLAERGSFIPFILGTYRIGCLVAWVGKIAVNTENVSQQGWHILCVGPGRKLLAIFEGGKKIYPTGNDIHLDSTLHPSGTQVALANGRGRFRIYWGDALHPIDPALSDPISGVGATFGNRSARWNNVMFIVWDKKKLGAEATSWPQMEYEVQVRPRRTDLLADSASWMVGNGDPLINNGANPAHAIMQIITDTYPHGVGIPIEEVGLNALESYGVLLEEEEQPVNIISIDGDTAVATIQDICMDTSTFITQYGQFIVPVTIRKIEDVDIPDIPDKALIPPLPEKEFLLGDKASNKVMFVYKERKLNYRDNDITMDDDADNIGRLKVSKLELATVIDNDIANKVVDRRQQEEAANLQGFKVNVGRGARGLSPGQVFKTAELGNLRIISVERSTESANTTFECLRDQYSLRSTGQSYAPPASGGSGATAVRDIVYDFMELPPPFKVSGLSIVPLRHIAFEGIEGALIDISSDGITYANISSNVSRMITGQLQSAMAENDSPLQETGPTIINVPNDANADVFVDLASQDSRWRTGEQVIFIGGELCFFRNLVLTGAGQYQIEGLIRGRKGSLVSAHAANDRVWILPYNEISNLQHGLIIKNNTLRLRALTFIGGNILSAADADPVATHLLTGLTLTPYPPVNFRAEDGMQERLNTFVPGAAVKLKWDNRSRNGDGSVAGTQGAGAPVYTTPGMDGQLLIVFKTTLGVVKRTVFVNSGTFYDYPNATLVADFAGEPSAFDITYSQVDGSYGSIEKTVRITRR